MLVTWLVAAWLTACAGAAFGTIFSTVDRSRVESLVHIATGVLLGIAMFDILPEAKAVLAWPAFLGCTVSGYALLWAVGRFVFHVCPSCAIAHTDPKTVIGKGTLLLLTTSLGIHCMLDGLAVATGAQLSSRAEFSAVAGVGIHKFPEGLALGLLLIGAGYSRSKVLLAAFAIEFLTVVGGAAGRFVPMGHPPVGAGAVFALVGGGFLYLVLNAMRGAMEHGEGAERTRGIATEFAAFAATGVVFGCLAHF
jgi:zinc transporter ZupT